MKHFKKFFSYLVALTMVLSLAAFTGVKVHAEGNYKLTINNVIKGHTLKMYQILTGKVSGTEGKYVLSDAKWGAGVSSITFSQTDTKVITADDVGKTVDEATMGKLANLKDPEKSIEVNENKVYKTPIVSDDSNTVEFEGVEGGYYVVTDTATNTTSDDNDPTVKKHTVTYRIVQVVGPTTVNEKAATIQSEKKVEDVNDSTGTITSGQSANNLLSKDELGDSADYDIGDKINYTIEAKLPENYAAYTTFPLTFVDTMSEGLTYNEDAILHFGKDDTGVEVKNLNEDQLVKDSTKVEYSSAEANKDDATKNTATKYSWAIKDLKTLTDKSKTLNAGDIVYITYTATLNQYAVIGSKGNPNKMHIAYNNNPKINTPNTNDETPDDTNIVFTYEAVFNKVDQDNKPLTGADFTLYKFVKSEKGADNYKGVNGTWTNVTTLGNGENKPSKETKANGEAENATFTFKGIDDGYYKLVESTTPDRYNTMEDKYFTITADHDILSSDPSLTRLNVTGDLDSTKTDKTATTDTEAGTISANIENKTGGMGTTLLYVAGGILVACAAAYVVMSRKHSTNK